MIRLFVLLALILSFILLFGCQSYLPSAISNNSSLDVEARKEAEKEFNKFFTLCGDSYFSHYYDNTLQYHTAYGPHQNLQHDAWGQFADVSVRVSSAELTNADKRNDLVWKGTVYFESKTFRTLKKGPYNSNPETLSEWRDGGNFFSISLKKYKSLGWKDFDYDGLNYGLVTPKRTILVSPTWWQSPFWPADLSEYVKEQPRRCSESEKEKLLELDNQFKICNTSGYPESYSKSCNAIECNEQGYEKVECPQIPEQLRR